VAAILEGVRQAIESGKALPKLEILFTVGEEAGLYGAKAFDVSLLTSKTMYVLDSPGRIGRIVNGAPGRALLEAQVFGKAAHAGNEPEKGIDAAKIMAEMLATMETGRLDENTTSNFSHLWSKTCEAMNVVCDHAILRGEMRSRSGEKLDRYEAYFQSHCREIAEKRGARVEFKRENTFLPFFIPEDSEMIQIVTESLKEMGIEPQINGGGGGMDGNIFNQKGITCVGIATGYFKNHSTEEYLYLDDFYHAGELVARIIGRFA
jgi:tripeptide aminopeptidase